MPNYYVRIGNRHYGTAKTVFVKAPDEAAAIKAVKKEFSSAAGWRKKRAGHTNAPDSDMDITV